MPLSEKVRVEVYLPDLPMPEYRDLLDALEQELTYTFGGCTTLHGLSGNYLSDRGTVIPDRVNLLYTDLPLTVAEDRVLISLYADQLRDSAFRALDEEAILVTVYPVYHAR